MRVPTVTEPGSLTMSAVDAMAHFDGLEPCEEGMLRGLWKGREVSTGHPLDGSLANVSWFGKRFDSATEVHPLVVADAFGNPYPLNPEVVPLRMITSPVRMPSLVRSLAPMIMTLARPMVSTRNYGAHLTKTAYRGVPTAAMVYNNRPLIDVFRRIDSDTVLSVMDHESMEDPYFFVLQRYTPYRHS